ncbi:MAG: hypothetical protein LLG14_04650, partial [Nocardiaceae bacterium]|nr:hypothetical protein [Nocardiaceae bacterium]
KHVYVDREHGIIDTSGSDIDMGAVVDRLIKSLGLTEIRERSGIVIALQSREMETLPPGRYLKISSAWIPDDV